MSQHNWLDAFLEDNPQLLYLGARPRGRTNVDVALQAVGGGRRPVTDITRAEMNPYPTAGSRRFGDYWLGQGTNIYNEYLSDLSRQAIGGRVPPVNATFGNFLGDYPWLQRWYEMTPTERGMGTSRFAPQVRWQL